MGGAPFPMCAEGLVCVDSGMTTIEGAENICIKSSTMPMPMPMPPIVEVLAKKGENC